MIKNIISRNYIDDDENEWDDTMINHIDFRNEIFLGIIFIPEMNMVEQWLDVDDFIMEIWWKWMWWWW